MLDDIDYIEASEHYTLMDAARIIDNDGVAAFLERVNEFIRNPVEDTITYRLVKITKDSDNGIYKDATGL